MYKRKGKGNVYTNEAHPKQKIKSIDPKSLVPSRGT